MYRVSSSRTAVKSQASYEGCRDRVDPTSLTDVSDVSEGKAKAGSR